MDMLRVVLGLFVAAEIAVAGELAVAVGAVKEFFCGVAGVEVVFWGGLGEVFGGVLPSATVVGAVNWGFGPV